jgi:hypothetical protein
MTEIKLEDNENHLASIDVTKIAYRQTKDGMLVTFSMSPNDNFGKIAELPLGWIGRIHVTEPNIGI